MAKDIHSIEDLALDPRNANRGTMRGRRMVEESLRVHGAGRSILVDKDGEVVAGNKTLEAWADIADMDDILVVRTRGDRLVVVQREDLDLDGDGGKAAALAVLDNRTTEVGLEWDPEVLAGLQADGVDLGAAFHPEEFEELMVHLERYDFSQSSAVGRRDRDEPVFLKLVVSIQHHAFIEQVLRCLMEKESITRGEAFVRVCELAQAT